jgi:hypothetical protein
MSAKSTTKQQKKSRGELRKQLARDISSILNNPECPAVLFNDIADSITEMSSDLGDEFYHSPEIIERGLNAHIAKEEKRRTR